LLRVRNVKCEFLLTNDLYFRVHFDNCKIYYTCGVIFNHDKLFNYVRFGTLFRSTDIDASDSMFIKIRNEFFKIALEPERPELQPNNKYQMGPKNPRFHLKRAKRSQTVELYFKIRVFWDFIEPLSAMN
jgi:hypothetical protein